MIKLIPTLEEGWKKKENRRFGSIFVINFTDQKTGKVLFKYAPLCEDEKKFQAFFHLMRKYDAIVSEIKIVKDEVSK